MNTSQVFQYLAAAGIRHICDNSFNRIELKRMARQYPSWGTVIEATDMSMLARAMGCYGVDVDSVKGLEAALAGPRAKDRPLVIGAWIDSAQYAAQFSAGLAGNPSPPGSQTLIPIQAYRPDFSEGGASAARDSVCGR